MELFIFSFENKIFEELPKKSVLKASIEEFSSDKKSSKKEIVFEFSKNKSNFFSSENLKRDLIEKLSSSKKTIEEKKEENFSSKIEEISFKMSS